MIAQCSQVLDDVHIYRKRFICDRVSVTQELASARIASKPQQRLKHTRWKIRRYAFAARIRRRRNSIRLHSEVLEMLDTYVGLIARHQHCACSARMLRRLYAATDRRSDSLDRLCIFQAMSIGSFERLAKIRRRTHNDEDGRETRLRCNPCRAQHQHLAFKDHRLLWPSEPPRETRCEHDRRRARGLMHSRSHFYRASSSIGPHFYRSRAHTAHCAC
jgi:hypothetical protein